MAKTNENTTEILTIPDEALANKIHTIRDQKVMLDSDLAELYGVETKRLNEQVPVLYSQLYTYFALQTISTLTINPEFLWLILP